MFLKLKAVKPGPTVMHEQEVWVNVDDISLFRAVDRGSFIVMKTGEQFMVSDSPGKIADLLREAQP
jgi:hypothetical protein